MKIATHVARYLLGAVFFVFGLNGFFSFIKLPPMPTEAGNFLGALVNTGYLMNFIKGTEVVCGALLLAGIAVPLALVALTPVLINIVLFHIYLTPPKDAVSAFVFLALHLFLVWRYRNYYRPLFALRATPG